MDLMLFKFEETDGSSINNFDTQVTVLDLNGEPWFVAADVCKILGIVNTSDALSSLDEDEKLTSVIPRAGQNRSVNLVSESGLYELVFRSNKPVAKTFKRWLRKEVIPALRKTGTYSVDRTTIPNFVVRYNENFDKVDPGYFSVIGELFIRVYGKFHSVGYEIPNASFSGTEIRPDTSVGKMFPKYLKDNYPDLQDKYKMYPHTFADGTIRDCRQYENIVLPAFIEYVEKEWLPKKAQGYFNDRDKKALDYLPKLIGK